MRFMEIPLQTYYTYNGKISKMTHYLDTFGDEPTPRKNISTHENSDEVTNKQLNVEEKSSEYTDLRVQYFKDLGDDNKEDDEEAMPPNQLLKPSFSSHKSVQLSKNYSVGLIQHTSQLDIPMSLQSSSLSDNEGEGMPDHK